MDQSLGNTSATAQVAMSMSLAWRGSVLDNLLMQGTPKEVQESPKVRAACLGVEH